MAKAKGSHHHVQQLTSSYKFCEGTLTVVNESYREAWKTHVEFETEVVGRETHPQLLQIVPPNGIVVTIVYQVQIGDAKGLIAYMSSRRVARAGHQKSDHECVFVRCSNLAGSDECIAQKSLNHQFRRHVRSGKSIVGGFGSDEFVQSRVTYSEPITVSTVRSTSAWLIRTNLWAVFGSLDKKDFVVQITGDYREPRQRLIGIRSMQQQVSPVNFERLYDVEMNVTVRLEKPKCRCVMSCVLASVR